MTQMSPPWPLQELPDENARVVCVGPAPRNVIFPWPAKLIPPEMLNFPAGSKTTDPAGAEAMAALMVEDVTLVLKVLQAEVEQIVLRLGMPPTTPAWLQSVARLESRMPDQFCAWEHSERQSKVRGKRSDCLRLILPR